MPTSLAVSAYLPTALPGTVPPRPILLSSAGLGSHIVIVETVDLAPFSIIAARGNIRSLTVNTGARREQPLELVLVR